MNKTSLLELAKKLNILRRNCMKTNEELEEASKTSSQGTKRLYLVQVLLPVWRIMMNFESSMPLTKKGMIKS